MKRPFSCRSRLNLSFLNVEIVKAKCDQRNLCFPTRKNPSIFKLVGQDDWDAWKCHGTCLTSGSTLQLQLQWKGIVQQSTLSFHSTYFLNYYYSYVHQTVQLITKLFRLSLFIAIRSCSFKSFFRKFCEFLIDQNAFNSLVQQISKFASDLTRTGCLMTQKVRTMCTQGEENDLPLVRSITIKLERSCYSDGCWSVHFLGTIQFSTFLPDLILDFSFRHNETMIPRYWVQRKRFTDPIFYRLGWMM